MQMFRRPSLPGSLAPQRPPPPAPRQATAVPPNISSIPEHTRLERTPIGKLNETIRDLKGGAVSSPPTISISAPSTNANSTLGLGDTQMALSLDSVLLVPVYLQDHTGSITLGRRRPSNAPSFTSDDSSSPLLDLHGRRGSSGLTSVQMFRNVSSSSSLGRRKNSIASTDSNQQQDVSTHVEITPSMTARDVLVKVLCELYDHNVLYMEMGGLESAVQRFGLFEAEFFEDTDEDVSLFSAAFSASAPASPSGAAGRSFGGGKRSGAFGATNADMSRRVHRLVNMQERPFYLQQNWKYFKALPSARRRSSSSISSSSNGNGRRSSIAENQRNFHFVVRPLTAEDHLLFAMGTGKKISTQTMMEVLPSNPAEVLRNQQLKTLPADRLERRLTMLNREEKRVLEECRDRYAKLRAQIQRAEIK